MTRQALDEATYDSAYQRGRGMTLDAAVDFALEAETEVRPPAPREPADTPLTRREREVAQLVADGMTNKDIAAKLIISQRTAEAHAEHILTKLGSPRVPKSPPGSPVKRGPNDNPLRPAHRTRSDNG